MFPLERAKIVFCIYKDTSCNFKWPCRKFITPRITMHYFTHPLHWDNLRSRFKSYRNVKKAAQFERNQVLFFCFFSQVLAFFLRALFFSALFFYLSLKNWRTKQKTKQKKQRTSVLCFFCFVFFKNF